MCVKDARRIKKIIEEVWLLQGNYNYFIHPVTDGIPAVKPEHKRNCGYINPKN